MRTTLSRLQLAYWLCPPLVNILHVCVYVALPPCFHLFEFSQIHSVSPAERLANAAPISTVSGVKFFIAFLLFNKMS